MTKNILIKGTAATFGIALFAVAMMPSAEQNYVPRATSETSSVEEPNSMMWAKLDNRTGEYNPSARAEVTKIINNRVSRDVGLSEINFESKGPDNVGGRTRAVLEVFHKPDTLYAGGVTGGIFASYDGGANWEPHAQFQNDEESSAIIASIHQDTSTDKSWSGNIYVGTGSSFDAFATSARVAWPGYGIYLSTDDGETFTHLESTTPSERYSTQGDPWIAVNRIKTNSLGWIYAATEYGLQVSKDQGKTWFNPVYQNNQSLQVTGKCADVVVTADDAVLISFFGGQVYFSEDGDDKTFELVNSNGLPASGNRTALAYAKKGDEEVFYVIHTDGDACLNVISKSSNGQDWEAILFPHDDFTPLTGGGGYCQGTYDLAIVASPRDPNTIFIGGISLWRYDGGLARVATEGGSPPFQDVLDYYVHADKHYFYYSPNDKKRMYVTSDGGIAVTTNRGNTWQGINKGYITTQYYGIAHSTEPGIIAGGAQDNGTLIVLDENVNDPNIGYSVFGNDGIDCDMSQETAVIFASSQNGLVVRVDLSLGSASQPPFAFFSDMDRQSPVFHTVVKLWENANDPTSKDSIEFSLEPTEIAIATGNGILRNFNETVSPVQPAAKVIRSSIKVSSGDQKLRIGNDNKTLRGDGEGEVVFNSDGSMDISINFDEAPSENSNVFVSYEEKFEANDVLILESNNLKSLQGSHTFEHRLETNLNPGDKIKVQDPVQSFLFSTGARQTGGNIRFYRNVLNAQALPPTPLAIEGVGNQVTCIEITQNGNTAFIGSANTVYRIDGLNDVYTQEDADALNPIAITTVGGGVTGIAIDPNNDNRLIVTGGGYGTADRVRYTENALDATPNFVNVHGDMPPFPVYDAEFIVEDPTNNSDDASMVLLGTEFGIWGTKKISTTGTSWSNVNNDLTWVPVYDIRQQALPFEKAHNSGMIYVGTHGRGFWASTDLVGIDDVDGSSTDDAVADFKVYPNPMQSEGRMEFTSGFNGNVTLSIYDMNGRRVKTWQRRVSAGTNTIPFNANELRSGTYFATIETEGSKEVSKFMILR